MNHMIAAEQALALASQEFTRQGMDVQTYEIMLDEKLSKGDFWMIWYDKKGPFPIPGGKHLVRVSKATGEAVFMKGE